MAPGGCRTGRRPRPGDRRGVGHVIAVRRTGSPLESPLRFAAVAGRGRGRGSMDVDECPGDPRGVDCVIAVWRTCSPLESPLRFAAHGRAVTISRATRAASIALSQSGAPVRRLSRPYGSRQLPGEGVVKVPWTSTSARATRASSIALSQSGARVRRLSRPYAGVSPFRDRRRGQGSRHVDCGVDIGCASLCLSS